MKIANQWTKYLVGPYQRKRTNIMIKRQAAVEAAWSGALLGQEWRHLSAKANLLLGDESSSREGTCYQSLKRALLLHPTHDQSLDEGALEYEAYDDRRQACQHSSCSYQVVV